MMPWPFEALLSLGFKEFRFWGLTFEGFRLLKLCFRFDKAVGSLFLRCQGRMKPTC